MKWDKCIEKAVEIVKITVVSFGFHGYIEVWESVTATGAGRTGVVPV